MKSALRERLAPAKLHHQRGHDLFFTPAPAAARKFPQENSRRRDAQNALCSEGAAGPRSIRKKHWRGEESR
jgi:hypothetical protein